MKRVTTSKAFAAQVIATNAGRIVWPRQQTPLTDKERAAFAAIGNAPPTQNAYSALLASGNDWLSRKRREHPEALADTTNDD
jgi:hypothetical protein